MHLCVTHARSIDVLPLPLDKHTQLWLESLRVELAALTPIIQKKADVTDKIIRIEGVCNEVVCSILSVKEVCVHFTPSKVH